MKNLVISCILIAIVIIFTIFSTLFTVKTCEKMLVLIDSGEVETAIELWEKREIFISLFIRDVEINSLNQAISFYRLRELQILNESEIVTTMKNAINEICELEKISFDSVF